MSQTAITQSGRFTWSIQRYHRLIASGVLEEDDRIELLNGEIVAMPPINPLHADLVDTLLHELLPQVAGRAILRVQNPITLPNDSEPEPDIALVIGERHRYRERHPGPDEVLLLIEVADSSARHDMRTKLPVYAEAGIPEVWIVEAERRRISVFTQPEGNGYRVTQVVVKDGAAPTGISGVSVRVEHLFG